MVYWQINLRHQGTQLVPGDLLTMLRTSTVCRIIFPGALLILAAMLLPLHSQKKNESFVIVNAMLADGTGSPLRKANVRVAFSHIVGIGDLQPEKEETVIDAAGLVLAPGFVDIHSHSENGLLSEPLAESQLSQGITTIIMRGAGESPWPMITWWRGF